MGVNIKKILILAFFFGAFFLSGFTAFAEENISFVNWPATSNEKGFAGNNTVYFLNWYFPSWTDNNGHALGPLFNEHDTLPSGCMLDPYSDRGNGYRLIACSSGWNEWGLWFWKLKAPDWTYFCTYDRYSDNLSQNFWWVIEPTPRVSTYTCEWTFNWWPLVNINWDNPTQEPVNPPINTEINGLQCTTKHMPIIEATSWYTDFWNLSLQWTWATTMKDGTPGLGYVGKSVDELSWDTVGILDYWSGSNISVWSIHYPTTDRTTVRLNDDATTSILIQLDRNWATAPFNVVQFHWTSQQWFPYWGVGRFYLSSGEIEWPRWMFSHSWVAMALLSNWFLSRQFSVEAPVSWFSGIRVWYAPIGPVTQCSSPKDWNYCQFRSYGNTIACMAEETVWGIENGVCGITWSGSVYGSGACVPLQDASGSIIKVELPWTFTYVTNPDGTKTKVTIPKDYNDWSSVFSCDIKGDDSWYTILGSYLSCPFTTIPVKIYNRITQPLKEVQDNVQINNLDTRSYTWATWLVWPNAQLSSNPLILAFKWNLDSIENDDQHPWGRWLRLAFAIAMLAICFFIMGTVVWFIKRDKY